MRPPKLPPSREVQTHGVVLDESAVTHAWEVVMHRVGPILPFFAKTQLSTSASHVARELGFFRADVLARYLMGQHLPPFLALRNGVYVVQLIERHEGGERIAHWARTQGHYESMYYRFVHSVTGYRWTTLVAHGSIWRKAVALRE